MLVHIFQFPSNTSCVKGYIDNFIIELFVQTKQEQVKYFYLTCDLPPPPLYKDEMESTRIPQVSLATLLNKFNGKFEKEYKTHKESFMKRFEIQMLPPYLVLYFKRFVSNYFRNEKYPTIVTFPVSSFDFIDLLLPEIQKLHKLVFCFSFSSSNLMPAWQVHDLWPRC